MLRHTPWSPSLACRRAFTLIELLSVIAIVGILAALLIGGLSKIRDAARRSECSSNLRQIGAAYQLYAADNKGLYPALSYHSTYADKVPNPNPSKNNWMTEISPYVYRETDFNTLKKTGAASNITHCPSWDLLFTTQQAMVNAATGSAGYGMNYHLNVSGMGNRVTDGNTIYDTRFLAIAIPYPATTVLVGDSGNYHIDVSGAWTVVPITTEGSEGYYSGAPTRHGTTANYLFCDGHVATLTPTAALPFLATRN